MYVWNKPQQIGQLASHEHSWVRDILVTTAAIVVGTVVVEQLRQRRLL